MKRAVKKLAFLIIFFILNSQVNANSLLEKKIRGLSEEEVKKFSSLLKKTCRSERFFKNLVKHKSFPSFGGEKSWKKKCKDIQSHLTIKEIKEFIIGNFNFKKIDNKIGLLTGYYEPIIKVSRTKDDAFKFPILKQNKIYYEKSREFIEKNFNEKDVILWTDDLINLFFLHIQGSGIGEFKNKQKVRIGYSGNNGLKYTSIGKELLKKKYMKPTNINLFSIKDWLRKNPKNSKEIMNKNERFIFFKVLKNETDSHASGALGIQLEPNFSIAVDKKVYPLGLPLIIEVLSNETILPVVSLDTGAAIVGPNRADLFLGQGKIAEQVAGKLKKKIFLYSLIPYNN